VSPLRVQRQRNLAAWHERWATQQAAAGVDGPVPADRPVPSDYNLHVPDLEAPAGAEDEFHARARQIMDI
jgi:hypothetical protein